MFDKNYWSNYTGYDLDKNGIGDVPYRPVKLFSYIVNQNSRNHHFIEKFIYRYY